MSDPVPVRPSGLFGQRLPWLGPDLQTLRDTLRPQRQGPDRARPICIDLGAGQALLGRYTTPINSAAAGLVVLVHGLGGCSEGTGIRRLANQLDRAGFAVLRLNMRGAGAGRPLASGTYAAQCNLDLLPALERARQLADQRPLFGVGLSLGGTMLLNGMLQSPLLDGLVCVSSPLDLISCTEQFDLPRNRIYRRWVLRGLRQLTLADPDGVSDRERSALTGPARVRTLQAFDALITAPRWGYSSVRAYYEAASPLQPLLAAMEAGATLPPLLLIHAADDPWVPVAATQQLAASASSLACPWLNTLIAAHGGHNGFHGLEDNGQTGSWADRQTLAWLEGRLLRTSPPGSCVATAIR